MTTCSTNDAARPEGEDLYERALLGQHGELMNAEALTRLLQIGSARTFRRAALSGRLPVSVFRIPGRRGWFARTRDIAAWLATAGNNSLFVPGPNT